MTLPVEQVRYVYVGPISVGAYVPIPFSYSKPEDVKATRDNTVLELNVDYAVSGQNIIMNTIVASVEKLVIYRDTPIDNDAYFPQEAIFNSAKLNDSLDKLTRQNQEQEDTLQRAIKFPRTVNEDIAKSLSFPLPDEGKAIIWENNNLANSKYNFDEVVDLAKEYSDNAAVQADIATTKAQEANHQALIAQGAAQEAQGAVILVTEKAEQALIDIDNEVLTGKDELSRHIDTLEGQAIETIEDTTQTIINEAQSWAIGTMEQRPEGSAKYWANVAKESAQFDTYTRSEIDNALLQKQDVLETGVGLSLADNMLTINTNLIATQQDLSDTTTLLTGNINAKQDKLIAGPNITINGNVISATGGGGTGDAYSKAETNALLDLKQDKLKQGTNISIGSDGTLSCTLDAYTRTETTALLNNKQAKLTAGSYISLDSNTINVNTSTLFREFSPTEWEQMSTIEKNAIDLALVTE